MKARVLPLALAMATAALVLACGTQSLSLPSSAQDGGSSEQGFRTLANGCGVSSAVTVTEDGVIMGSDGTDLINCSSATEAVEVRAGGGRDAITGGPFDDTLYGGDGVDGIRAGEGDDLLDGGAGDDQSATTETPALEGGPGDDVILGREGDDALHGGLGHDTCNGGTGEDLYKACESTRDPDA